MKNLIKLAFLIAFGAAFHAEAATIYTNGPVNGTIGSYTISGNEVSNSFTVSVASTLTSAEVGLYTFTGGTPTSLDWAIGTTFFGSDISFGTAVLSNTFYTVDPGPPADVYTSSFALTGVLAPGTYYLTLLNGVASNGGRLSWDVNNGPSTAQSGVGFQTPIPSESFTLFGTTASVPDSGSTFGLLSLSLAGLFGASRFRSIRLA